MKFQTWVMLAAALLLAAIRPDAPAAEPAPAVKAGAKLPDFTQPVLLGTAEADAIARAIQVFPPDNPWNADVSRWPVHPNSAAIVASIGNDKPLRYNTDMSYVFVPPGQ